MDADGKDTPMELVDFSHPVSTDRLSVDARLSHSGVHVVRGWLAPHDGGEIGAAQLSAVVHKGEPFDMEWRLPGSDRLHVRRIEFGDVHINPGDMPFFQRWKARPLILGMALDHKLIDRVGRETFGRDVSSLETRIAVRDDRLMATATAWREELANEGAGGRLLTEHLGIILAVHLFRNYGDAAWQSPSLKGGLSGRRLRRVLDYIEAHLDDDLSITALAGVAGLSLHYFAEAFRDSTGTPPHRFILMRRIERAKILLLTTAMTITEVALAVGYSSHSHFALKFRELTGAGPRRFRLDRKG